MDTAPVVSQYPIQAEVTLRRGSLYKYKSLKGEHLEHVSEIIRDAMIYCPRPSRLNDPQECKPEMSVGDLSDSNYRSKVEAWARRCVALRVPQPSEPEIQAELQQLDQARLESLAKETTPYYQRAIEEQYRILSFADSNQNHHLWVNYADGYEGICLGFFVNFMFGTAYKVRYADAIPAFDIATGDGVFDTLVATALVKRLQWMVEGEYRLILRDPPIEGDLALTNQKLRFPRKHLTSIVFGYRASMDDRHRLLELIRRVAPHMRVFVATGGPPFRTVKISRMRT